MQTFLMVNNHLSSKDTFFWPNSKASSLHIGIALMHRPSTVTNTKKMADERWQF